MKPDFETSGRQRPILAQQLVEDLQLASDRTTLLLVGGCGGSGKSTLAAKLAELTGAPVVHVDDFTSPRYPKWDHERLDKQVIVPLSEGRNARYQRYDWGEERLAEWHEFEPCGLVVVEGVFALTIDTHGLRTKRVWVDAPYVTRLSRAVERDGESMRETWTDKWMLAEHEYALKHELWHAADFVVDGTTPYE